MRVVCQGHGGWKSLGLLAESIAKARAHGYRLRPSQPKLSLSRWEALRLLWENLALANRCAYNEIQPAVRDVAQQRPRRGHARRIYTEADGGAAQPLTTRAAADFHAGGLRRRGDARSFKYQAT